MKKNLRSRKILTILIISACIAGSCFSMTGCGGIAESDADKIKTEQEAKEKETEKAEDKDKDKKTADEEKESDKSDKESKASSDKNDNKSSTKASSSNSGNKSSNSSGNKNSGNSSSSSGNKNSGSSSSGGSSSGGSSSSSKPSHSHSWQPVTATRQIVTGYENKVVDSIIVCVCGARDVDYDHIRRHMDNRDPSNTWIDYVYDNVPIYGSETYVDHYKCSCGATK